MAADMFVWINGLTGPATEKAHKGWFVVKSVSWGVERLVDIEDMGSAQRGYGNAKFNKVAFSSEMGTGSMSLAQAAASGKNYGTMQINMCRSPEGGAVGLVPYLSFALENAMVHKWELTCNEDSVPEETWEVAYRALSITYAAVDNDNKKQKPEIFGWDVQEGEYKSVSQPKAGA
jgi:type VI secretion system secreted protein Hcp